VSARPQENIDHFQRPDGAPSRRRSRRSTASPRRTRTSDAASRPSPTPTA
jgi:hypothetical protein